MSTIRNDMDINNKSTLRINHFTLAFIILITVPSAQAELYFNPRFLANDPAAVADLSAFAQGQEAPPGTYRVDLFVNENYLTTRDVLFNLDPKQQTLLPCVTPGQLAGMGVNLASLPAERASLNDRCEPIAQLISGATARFDVGQQRLYLTVPQIFMTSRARGYVSPDLWDNGIVAGLLNYSLTGNQSRDSTGKTSRYNYLNLQSGVNLGAWRLRDNSAWSHVSGYSYGETRWQHINTYAERDVVSLRARLTLGDSYSPGEIFDSLNFRGVQIASDDTMLPDSQRGFAPIIRGIARGTAQVSIKQNGYEIYRDTVPPGPFVINDLYAAGSSGDLQVSIIEADGSTQVMSVPYSSVPLLQREGYHRYALTAGDYRSGNTLQDQPGFFQGTLLSGLASGVTAYGGTQLAERYQAVNVGVGKNFGQLGALSLDVTQSHAHLPDDSERRGQSLRFLYNKSLNELGTNIQLVGYRYSSKGYFTLADTAYKRMAGYRILTQDGAVQVKPQFTDYYNLAYNKRGKLQLNLTQQLDRRSTLYVNGSFQSYWNTNKQDQQLQVGVNTAVEDITWGLSYSLNKNAWQDNNDRLLAFNLTIPLSHWMRSDSQSAWRYASASYNVTHDLHQRATNTAGLYGTLLPDNNLSYSVQTGYASGGQNTASAANGYTALSYRGGYGNANAGYSHNADFRQFYYGLSGGVVAHENGLTFSQPLADTVVLIKAPGATNTKIENQPGVRTDWRGYAVVPWATDYRENRVALDTNTLADNVDLDDAVVSVVPTRGAVVRADFQPRVGLKVLMTIAKNGKPLPFGAVVTSSSQGASSIVADRGQVYLSGLPRSGELIASWGKGADATCRVHYRLPQESERVALSEYQAECL